MISLLITVFSHVTSDFIFQTDNICNKRLHDNASIRIKANGQHSIITFLTVFLLVSIFYSSISEIFVFAAIIGGSHFFIDSVKSFTCRKVKNCWTSFCAFFLDQILHLLVIFTLWINFDFKLNSISFKVKGILESSFSIANGRAFAVNLLIFIIIFVYVTLGGDIIIKNLLYALRVIKGEAIEEIEIESNAPERYKIDGQGQQNKTIGQTAAAKDTGSKEKNENKKKKNKKGSKREKSKELNIDDRSIAADSGITQDENAKEATIEQVTVTAAKDEDKTGELNSEKVKKDSKGKYIGILERIIIMILTMYSSFTSIAFVLTAKSIVRSKKIEEEPEFAEEYLIGTLGSILLAILGGCAFNLIHI